MAGIDGILNRIEPSEPVDKDLYGLEPEELKGIPRVPHSLEASLEALENDHDFLTAGNVMSEDFLEAYAQIGRASCRERGAFDVGGRECGVGVEYAAWMTLR